MAIEVKSKRHKNAIIWHMKYSERHAERGMSVKLSLHTVMFPLPGKHTSNSSCTFWLVTWQRPASATKQRKFRNSPKHFMVQRLGEWHKLCNWNWKITILVFFSLLPLLRAISQKEFYIRNILITNGNYSNITNATIYLCSCATTIKFYCMSLTFICRNTEWVAGWIPVLLRHDPTGYEFTMDRAKKQVTRKGEKYSISVQFNLYAEYFPAPHLEKDRTFTLINLPGGPP